MQLHPLDLLHLSGHFGIPRVDPDAVMVPAPDDGRGRVKDEGVLPALRERLLETVEHLRHQRGPAGMSAQSQHGRRTTRRHALPSFTAAWPIMPG
jgi:hypothetical protein